LQNNTPFSDRVQEGTTGKKVALKGCFVDFLTRKQYPVKNTRRLEGFYDTGLATAFGKN
jgi:hypothetical protein